MTKVMQGLLLASLSLAVSAHAASAPKAAEPAIDCKNAMSTYEMNTCADQELEKLDKELNETYKGLMTSLAQQASSSDQTTRENAIEIRKRLVTSERAWVTFREADANLQATENLGGTAETLSFLSAKIESTKARIKQLKGLL